MKLKKGLSLVKDVPGTGAALRRQSHYELKIRLQLNQGEIVRHPEQCLSRRMSQPDNTDPDGFFHHQVRFDRENLIPGLFYTLDTMHIGGYRKVIISPHLAYAEHGVPGCIPPNAKLIAEIYVISTA